MILFIDTTDFNRTTFALSAEGKLWKKSYKIDPHKSHETLQKLDEFLKSIKVKPSPGLRPPSPIGRGEGVRVTKIIVNSGPGSFTGVRVGVTIAQALGFAWNVPVIAVPKEKFEIK
jgi:tRNA A37 threonylcarbamoyladenosine modification protein TsaB